MVKFSELNIKEEIVNSLLKLEIEYTTPIQEKSIPFLLEGKDVIGQAQTGTGKTFAYSIPLIENLDYETKDVKALVLCPTRELSLQVSKELDKLTSGIRKIKTCTIYGGESYEKQFKELKRNPQIVIGTPGRIIDQMERGNLKFDKISYLVLDEADEMLKMGFQEDLEKILSTMPKTRQTALFSATMAPFIKNVAMKYMNSPEMIKIEAKTLTVSSIDQMVYYCKKDSKQNLLIRILDFYQFKPIMIFANTKAMVDELVLFLQAKGFKADGLHGDLKQAVRDRVMTSFRNQSVDILIATDVAARGIDIEGIECVINYDIPNENELYVHRIGRTARAGSSGVSITFATSRGKQRIKDLEAYTKQPIRVCETPTVKEIETQAQKKLYLSIMDSVEKYKDNHDYDNLLMSLARKSNDPMPLLTALIHMIDDGNKREYPEIEPAFTRKSNERDNRKKNDKFGKKDSKGKKEEKKESNFKSKIEKGKNFSVIVVNVGEADKVKPNQLVCFFHDELKIHREHFGKIVIEKKHTFIEVRNEALRFFDGASKKKFNGRTLVVRMADKMPK